MEIHSRSVIRCWTGWRGRPPSSPVAQARKSSVTVSPVSLAVAWTTTVGDRRQDLTTSGDSMQGGLRWAGTSSSRSHLGMGSELQPRSRAHCPMQTAQTACQFREGIPACPGPLHRMSADLWLVKGVSCPRKPCNDIRFFSFRHSSLQSHENRLERRLSVAKIIVKERKGFRLH